MCRETKDRLDRWAIAGVLVTLTALQLAGTAGWTPSWWGVDQARFNQPWLPVALIAALVVCLSPLNRILGTRLFEMTWRTAGLRRWGWTLAGLCIGGAVFWLFRTAGHFLGDGFFWARDIIQPGWHPSFHEPLDSMLHRWLWKAGSNLFNWDGADAYRCLSILAGLGYLVLATVLKERAGRNRRERRFLHVSLLSVGAMQFFFGYVESYSLLALLVAAFLTVLYSNLRHREIWAALVAGTAVVTHLSGVVLLPALAAFVWMRCHGIRQACRPSMLGKLALALAAPVLVTVGLMVVAGYEPLKILMEGGTDQAWLPLLTPAGGDGTPYAMLSMANFMEVFNELLLAAPITAFLLIVLALRRGRGIRTGQAATDAVLVLAGGYLLFLTAFDLKLGVSRDWDIFAPLAIPLTLWGALYMARHFRGRLTVIAPGVLLYAVLQTGGYVAINADAGRAVTRMQALIDEGRWSGYARGDACDALRSWYYNRGEKEEALRYARLASEAVCNIRYYSNYAALMAELHQTDKARKVLEEIVQLDPKQFDAQLNLGALYAETGALRKAALCYARALQIDSTSPALHYNIGVLHLYRHDFKTAEEFFRVALRLDPHYVAAARMLDRLTTNQLSLAQ